MYASRDNRFEIAPAPENLNVITKMGPVAMAVKISETFVLTLLQMLIIRPNVD